MDENQVLHGSCHCGNIQYDFVTKLKIADFSVRRCDCSYCVKVGARYLSDPEGELIVKISDISQSNPYAFGTKTAEFIVCKRCGGIPLATCEIDGGTYGIVNVNTLDKAEHFGRHAKIMSYDEEELEGRISRRKKNWIGKVTYL